MAWWNLHGQRIQGGPLQGSLADQPGHHLILAEVKVGDLPQVQVFKLHITDPEGEAKQAARTPREAPSTARWDCLDLVPHYNGDIRTIFQQQYLSPRPQTCSVRLGVDGYSAWTFPYWKEAVPAIGLENLDQLDDGHGRILTPQNVPFRRFAAGRNIAFTSQWDNWPRSVTVPVESIGAKWPGCWCADRRSPCRRALPMRKSAFSTPTAKWRNWIWCRR